MLVPRTYPRAAFAADPDRSRGRQLFEPASLTRNGFQRDRDRIIHSTAFRRLAHKTQVFVPDESDHYRSRLTHTIEVAQIARALARALALDEDLAETLALAHDLGHAPFGHTGEAALDASMAPFGGFDHNAQALRIVTRLERRYAAFDGLNLTWETREGIVKHNGPLRTDDGAPVAAFSRRGIPDEILDHDRLQPLDLADYASAEAQVAAIADDVAYDAHDIDDGLRAGLFDLAAMSEVAFLRDLFDELRGLHPGLEPTRVIHELTRRVIARFIEDVVVESRDRLASAQPCDADAVRRAARPLVGFSRAMTAADRAIKAFLHRHMYRHPRLARQRRAAAQILGRCFACFFDSPTMMPAEWAAAAAGDEATRARAVADYLAGMTDRFALRRYKALFDDEPELV